MRRAPSSASSSYFSPPTSATSGRHVSPLLHPPCAPSTSRLCPAFQPIPADSSPQSGPGAHVSARRASLLAAAVSVCMCCPALARLRPRDFCLCCVCFGALDSTLPHGARLDEHRAAHRAFHLPAAWAARARAAAGPSSGAKAFCAPLFTARTLNARGQSWVTLSLR